MRYAIIIYSTGLYDGLIGLAMVKPLNLGPNYNLGNLGVGLRSKVNPVLLSHLHPKVNFLTELVIQLNSSCEVIHTIPPNNSPLRLRQHSIRVKREVLHSL
jgi:hypothetical protein